MSTAIAEITATNCSHQVVCYRCQYVGMEASSTRCPLCAFPLIVEALGDAVERCVGEIFARASVNDGAPPLPGVDASPRKAQLLAEARKQRIAEQRERSRQRPVTSPRATSRCGTGTSIAGTQSSRFGVVFALGGALVAGLVAAVLVHGGV